MFDVLMVALGLGFFLVAVGSLLTQSGQPSFRWRQRRRYRQFINSALMSIWVALQATAPASR
jgi:hypothetical protein